MSRPNTKGGQGNSLKPAPPGKGGAAGYNDPNEGGALDGSKSSSPRNNSVTSKTPARPAGKPTNGAKLPPLNAPGGGAASPRMSPALVAAINALVLEEDLFRGPIVMQEACVFLSQFAYINQCDANESTKGTLNTVVKHCKGLVAHSNVVDEKFDAVGKSLKQLHTESSSLKDCFERMLQEQKSDEKRLVEDLRVENKLLKTVLAERDRQVEDLQAELHAMKDQLTRRILRNDAESNFLRSMVSEQLKKLYIDVGTLRGQLHDRIDGAVASIQKASYSNGALRQLQQLVEEDNRLIQERSTGLHALIDEIGANDRFFDLETDGSTMHSNFPGAYRVKLRALTKEQLLNVLDVVSFEEGVVLAAGKALHARHIAVESTSRQQDATFAGQLTSR